MKTVLKTAPAALAVSVDEIKAHCRITSTVEDTYLETLINAATEHVEQITGRKLVSQTWKLLLDEWPGDAEITLPFGECSAVSSIKYTDSDAVETTWSDSDYVVDTDSVPGRVVIGYGLSWPSVELLHVNPIVVEFVSGYGGADAVPAALKHATKLLVGHWYENREPVVLGTIVANIPLTVDRLIWPFRLFGF